NRLLVVDGEQKDRLHILHIVAESSLLSNVPVVFFDPKKFFSGIGEANRNNEEIKKYDVGSDPLGFPAKTLKAGDQVHIDLNSLNPEALAEILGAGDKDFPRIMKMAQMKGGVDSLDSLAEKISAMGQTDEFSEFSVYKAARMLKLANVVYPKLFAGENNIGQIVRKGSANIATASVIDLSGIGQKASELLIHSIVKGILQSLEQGASGKLNAMIIIPDAELIRQADGTKKISTEIYSLLSQCQKHGVLSALSAEKSIDVEQVFRDEASVAINIVSTNDVGVQLKNRKAYRVLVRPALSKEA
ncbi:MAG: hypothetical protein NUV67_05885, partial [archaeon]|nr:hypothetical protein [archaeon]